MNILGFAAAAYDKFAAKKKLWRISEKSFVILALLLGGIGVFSGFLIFRHKTKHYKLFYTVGFITLAEYLSIKNPLIILPTATPILHTVNTRDSAFMDHPVSA